MNTARTNIKEAQGVAPRIATWAPPVVTRWVWKTSGATRSIERRPDQYRRTESAGLTGWMLNAPIRLTVTSQGSPATHRGWAPAGGRGAPGGVVDRGAEEAADHEHRRSRSHDLGVLMAAVTQSRPLEGPARPGGRHPVARGQRGDGRHQWAAVELPLHHVRDDLAGVPEVPVEGRPGRLIGGGGVLARRGRSEDGTSTTGVLLRSVQHPFPGVRRRSGAAIPGPAPGPVRQASPGNRRTG